jgi:hypothetical protein
MKKLIILFAVFAFATGCAHSQKGPKTASSSEVEKIQKRAAVDLNCGRKCHRRGASGGRHDDAVDLRGEGLRQVSDVPFAHGHHLAQLNDESPACREQPPTGHGTGLSQLQDQSIWQASKSSFSPPVAR